MEVDFALMADGVAHRSDGKLDLFGAAFDTVYAMQVPAMHTQLSLAIRVLLSRHEAQSDHRIEIILMSADGVEVAKARGDVSGATDDILDQVPAGRRVAVGAVLMFTNLLFPDYGTYHFAIHWDGNEARSPIVLYVAPPPSTAP